MDLRKQINKNRIPEHIAIIMDGNGRWAKKRNKMRLVGHNQGANTLKKIVEAAGKIGVKRLTVYAFSSENWNRPKKEVEGLMNLLMTSIDNEINKLNKNEIKISVIGNINMLPQEVRERIKNVIETTKNNKKFQVIIALSYSGRDEIITAAKKIANDAKSGRINPENINQKLFESYLYTKQIPDPELLIRTSGEERISNFLLYQLAYTELYFTNVLWPDFDEEELYKAIINYQKRERRFGKTSEQLN